MNEEKRGTTPDSQTEDQSNGHLYTVSQAAAILQVAEIWIYERTRKKTIPHRKLGKHIRFTGSDLSAIIRTSSRGPETETGTAIKEQMNA